MNEREHILQLLERDMSEWAEDTSLRLVWADLLQIDGDPLGTLVVLDHTAAQASDKTQAAKLREQADRLRKALSDRLWTQEAAPARNNPGVRLTWELGFVRELDIRTTKLDGTHTSAYHRRRSQTKAQASVSWIVPLLLRQPALRFVEVLRIDTDDVQAGQMAEWTRAGGLGAATLREIHIGRPPRARRRPSGAWEPGTVGGGRGPATEIMIGNFRRLRRLSIGGEMVRIPCRSGGSQTRKHHVKSLETRPLTSPNRASLSRALWDVSSLVHEAAFEVALALGPRASFLVEDLIWFLLPPLSKKDPRPKLSLEVLAAIGPNSQRVVPLVLKHAESLLTTQPRHEALLLWFAALGPLARVALPHVEALLAQPANTMSAGMRKAAKRAHKALTTA